MTYIAWNLHESQPKAGQICPLINLLSDTGLELGNLNLQDECDFQAAELAGLAEIFLKLSSSSSGNWSEQFCEYLATMISEVCYNPYVTVYDVQFTDRMIFLGTSTIWSRRFNTRISHTNLFLFGEHFDTRTDWGWCNSSSIVCFKCSQSYQQFYWIILNIN